MPRRLAVYSKKGKSSRFHENGISTRSMLAPEHVRTVDRRLIADAAVVGREVVGHHARVVGETVVVEELERPFGEAAGGAPVTARRLASDRIGCKRMPRSMIALSWVIEPRGMFSWQYPWWPIS